MGFQWTSSWPDTNTWLASNSSSWNAFRISKSVLFYGSSRNRCSINFLSSCSLRWETATFFHVTRAYFSNCWFEELLRDSWFICTEKGATYQEVERMYNLVTFFSHDEEHMALQKFRTYGIKLQDETDIQIWLGLMQSSMKKNETNKLEAKSTYGGILIARATPVKFVDVLVLPALTICYTLGERLFVRLFE